MAEGAERTPLKLLLDEHHDPAVAAELRRRGHDVVAVTERDDLRGRADLDLLRLAVAERRAIVTENVRDFAIAHRWSFDSGTTHYGIVFTHRSGVTLVRALEDFLKAHPADDDLRDQTHWLSPARV